MTRARKWLLIVVACIAAVAGGVLWTAHELMKCRYIATSRGYSPDKRFYTQIEGTHCDDDAKSHDRLIMGEVGKEDSSVLLDFNFPMDTVHLHWEDGPNGAAELHVQVRESAIKKRYGPYDNLPRVVVTSP